MPFKYGYDRTEEIQPLNGERILDEGEEIPEVHREYISGHGWLRLRNFVHKHTGANRIARVYGNFIAYAAPIEQKVVSPQPVEENATEALVVAAIEEQIAKLEPEPAPAPKKTRTKRKAEARHVNELVFDE